MRYFSLWYKSTFLVLSKEKTWKWWPTQGGPLVPRLKANRLLGKTVEFLLGAGMSLEYLVLLENKEPVKVHSTYVKVTEINLKDLPMVKTETIWRTPSSQKWNVTVKNYDCNRVKHKKYVEIHKFIRTFFKKSFIDHFQKIQKDEIIFLEMQEKLITPGAILIEGVSDQYFLSSCSNRWFLHTLFPNRINL